VSADSVQRSDQQECVKRWFAYDASCRCEPCVAASHRNAKLRRNGKLPPTRSDEAWIAVDRMLKRGMTVGAIAATAGLCPRTLSHSLGKRRDRPVKLSRTWAERLIAAEHKPVAGGRVVSLVAQRQLQALSALGHSMRDLETETGVKWQTLHAIRVGVVAITDVANVIAVSEVYDRLSMVPGTCSATRRNAAKAGWGTPLAWEHIDMADPRAKPRGMAS
jgi:hypothetical protein